MVDQSKIVYGILAILVVVVLAKSFMGSDPTITGNIVGSSGGESQIVEIGLTRAGYTDFTVEVNKPVILKNDGTLGGCGLYPVQAELGINANFAQTDNYEFTPTKKGTFTYSCSMGMFNGKITVV